MTNDRSYMEGRREGGVRVRIVGWAEAGEACLGIRTRVFVEEQGVSMSIEVDGLDPTCVHALAVGPGGEPVGTGRLLPDGRIGRMAVLPGWRGRGVGRGILEALEAEAGRRSMARVRLHAQVSAQGFYEKLGYRARGPVFEEAGIPHVEMEKRIG
ncbi:GNAT family N-acetyltransferase [Deferrisoma camini]|uniref:GNAT family N-acetyltransferase n=1 Tax=Deferrisoma camini TaxID=1035120 RepID=UPI0004BBD971|nr:GNAT family N-acetyltransferase [Deferrisoma camini]